MIGNKKVVVVMPAYNAEKTLKQTYDEIPFDIVDEVILTDDCSKDNTVEEAARLGIKEILVHERNKGYGSREHIDAIAQRGLTPIHRRSFVTRMKVGGDE